MAGIFQSGCCQPLEFGLAYSLPISPLNEYSIGGPLWVVQAV
jgi:hypothetical protein